MTLPRPKASLVIIAATLGAALVVSMLLSRSRLEATAAELAVTTTEAIFTTDSMSAPLLAVAHPDLLAQMSAESLERYLRSVPRLLGPIESIATISGGTAIPLLPLGNNYPTAQYEIELEFAGNHATARMEMVYEQGDWLVTRYQVQSPLLMN